MNFSQGVLFVELQDASRSEDTIKAIMTVIPTLEDGVTVEREKSTEEEKPSRMFSFQETHGCIWEFCCLRQLLYWKHSPGLSGCFWLPM